MSPAPQNPLIPVPDLLSANIAAATTLLAGLQNLAQPLTQAAALLAQALLSGQKVLCCGNGGSAADSAHLSAEFAGRYVLDRPGYPALDLSASHSLVTALINDFPPEQVFARQVQALGVAGDVLIAFTTSGNSTNVRLALEVAGLKRIGRIAFLGRDGGACKGLAEVDLIVPGTVTARIQEAHQLLYHTLCDALDPLLARGA